jgi:nucleoside-diphosphate-sugar epimerase
MSFVFVTGGSGFIGSHLVQALRARGERVRCVVRKNSNAKLLREAGAELIYGELNQPKLLEEGMYSASAVFHVAGLTSALTYDEMLRANRDGTKEVAKACAQQRTPPKLILVSSIAAAGPAPRGQIRVEADMAAPISNYGRSKLAGEQAALAFAGKVPTTIVRPGIVFGPRNKSLLPIFQSIKYLNVHVAPGYHSPPLSYIHVSDCVELLLRSRERGEVVASSQNGPSQNGQNGHSSGSAGRSGAGYYFAVAPEYPTYAEFGRMAAKLIRRPYVLVLPFPAPLPWVVGGVCQTLASLRRKPDDLNVDKIQEALAESWACSAEAAKRDLAFAPPKSLQERLAETMSWYQQEHWL